MYRIIKTCPYCNRPFFPKLGKEETQKYCRPTHRKNAFKRHKKSYPKVAL